MKELLMHLIDQFFMFCCLMVGIYLGSRQQKNKHSLEEKSFRKWYHKCLYCKHCSVRGKAAGTSHYSLFCFHPDCVRDFNQIDKVEPDFYCGKWEGSESFNTELFKAHSERCLESSNQGLKNFRQ